MSEFLLLVSVIFLKLFSLCEKNIHFSDMDTCENEVPVIDDSSNEMPVDLHNEMPVNGLPEINAENVEDRHVVNGDSYASRAARTVSYE